MHRLIVLIACLALACGTSSDPLETSTPQDSGAVDGGQLDGGEVDGGEVDGGEVDGGEVDGGKLDGGEVDGGEVDGGEVDGGEVDGGEVDGGEVDGGEVDGGEVDGGEVDGGEPESPHLIITFGMDDGYVEQVEAAAYLASKGFAGTIYVNTGLLDKPTFLSTAQLRQLDAAGHEITGHTVTHARLRDIDDEDEMRAEICDDRQALLDMGFSPVVSLAYPYGEYPEMAQSVAKACGYLTARRVGGLRNGPRNVCPACPVAEPFPVVNPFTVRTIPGTVMDTTKADDVLSDVDAAIVAGGWVNLLFHHFCDGPAETDCADNEYAIPHSRFEQMVDGVADRVRDSNGKVVVMTAEQVTRLPIFK